MSEEYIKTVVIDDPNYRPGELVPNSPTSIKPPEQRDSNSGDDDTIEADILPENVPSFDDTSWLT